MKTLVLGAGIVGSAAAWDLQRRGHDVSVADANPQAAAEAGHRFKIPSYTLTVTDQNALTDALKGYDLVVSAVPYKYGVGVAGAAVAARTHYLDFGGNPTVVAAQRDLNAAATEADVLVVPDCGLAPGVANVMATELIRNAREANPDTTIDSVQIRVGALPQSPVGALGYQLAFNPAGLINEYAEPCEVIEDAEYATVEPLARFEEVQWDRWGPLEAFSTAGGTSSMCSVHLGHVTNLEYKTLRYPGHGAVFAAMREIGLFDEEPGSSGVAPRSILLRALDEHLPRSDTDLVLVRTWLDVGDRRTTMEFEDVSQGGFSALARTTAFPATALADLILRGEVRDRGVHTMNECSPPRRLLDELRQVGISVR